MKVIYVCGYGRSGSTTLGRVLAQHHTGVVTGEVTHIASGAFLHEAQCSCGEQFPSCAYWNDVDRRLNSSTRRRAVSLRWRWLEGGFGLLLPLVALRRLVARFAFSERYPGVNFEEGCRAMADVAGGTFIDISKTTRLTSNRPRLLAAAGFDVDLYVAWRPANDVIASHRAAQVRRGRTGAWWRSASHVYIGRTIALVGATLCGRSLKVELKRVTLDETVRLAKVTSSRQERTNHMIAGNRSRLLPMKEEHN